MTGKRVRVASGRDACPGQVPAGVDGRDRPSGAGPRAYDLAEALLVGAGHGHVTESAAARLRAYAAGLDRREFAVCAGSVALTMAESFVRHGRAGEAAGAVPAMVRALKQALSLAGA